jgi:hypothetical protein
MGLLSFDATKPPLLTRPAMTPELSDNDQDTSDVERAAVLREFLDLIRTAKTESDVAVVAAKPALARIACSVVGHDHGQALRVRAILRSIYSGGSILADVSDLMALDWSLRKDLCAVLLAFGHGDFEYTYMRSAFEEAGDGGADWFLGEGTRKWAS